MQSFLLLFVLFSWGLGKFILRFGRLDSPQPLEKAHVCSGLYHKNISTLSSAEGSICHPLPLSLHGRLSSHICLPLVFPFLKKPGVFPDSHTNVPAETDYKQAHIVGCHPTHAKLKALYLGVRTTNGAASPRCPRVNGASQCGQCTNKLRRENNYPAPLSVSCRLFG